MHAGAGAGSPTQPATHLRHCARLTRHSVRLTLTRHTSQTAAARERGGEGRVGEGDGRCSPPTEVQSASRLRDLCKLRPADAHSRAHPRSGGRAHLHFFLLYAPPFPCLTVVGRERGAGTSSTQIAVTASAAVVAQPAAAIAVSATAPSLCRHNRRRCRGAVHAVPSPMDATALLEAIRVSLMLEHLDQAR